MRKRLRSIAIAAMIVAGLGVASIPAMATSSGPIPAGGPVAPSHVAPLPTAPTFTHPMVTQSVCPRTGGQCTQTLVPATTSYTICANSGNGNCINRSGCSTYIGSNIIMWYNDSDNCEGFDYVHLTGYCGGYVHAGCPFADPALNSRFNSEWLVAIFAWNSGYYGCVGTATSSHNGLLEQCPDVNGNGGGNGTIQVIGNNPYYGGYELVNKYWSNSFYNVNHLSNHPGWVCASGTIGHNVAMGDASDNSGYCAWDGAQGNF